MEKTGYTKKNKDKSPNMFFWFISFSILGMRQSSRPTHVVTRNENRFARILLTKDDDNTLFLQRVDVDGFLIGELVNPEKAVYVYDSEKEKLVDCIRKV
jgi:hypothetical protein